MSIIRQSVCFNLFSELCKLQLNIQGSQDGPRDLTGTWTVIYQALRLHNLNRAWISQVEMQEKSSKIEKTICKVRWLFSQVRCEGAQALHWMARWMIFEQMPSQLILNIMLKKCYSELKFLHKNSKISKSIWILIFRGHWNANSEGFNIDFARYEKRGGALESWWRQRVGLNFYLHKWAQDQVDPRILDEHIWLNNILFAMFQEQNNHDRIGHMKCYIAHQ